MMKTFANYFLILSLSLFVGCDPGAVEQAGSGDKKTAEYLLGNPEYVAMSYSGWRTTERAAELCPTVGEIKNDLRLLHAMGVRFIRTYNTQDFPQSKRTLEAIAELQAEDPGFEMYVMLGAWIECLKAYTDEPDHTLGNTEMNRREIARAIEMAVEYPDIIKVIAVGNEAMVDWQTHFVGPDIILKWVNVLRAAREDGTLPEDLWITTSDNWAALGGEEKYHSDELLDLLRALDFVSLHTYAFHDTYYYLPFDWALEADADLPLTEQRKRAVDRAVEHQRDQLDAARSYMLANGIEKPIHIGETGWGSRDDSYYGPEGTHAADEYTHMLFHDAVRDWTESEGMSCFYFTSFDEPWKSSTVNGSESHFGLFTLDGKAKVVIWDLVDAGVFDGLGRNGNPVTKTFDGDRSRLMETVEPPIILKHDP